VSINDLALKMLFVTIQENNLEVCIENALNSLSVVHPYAITSIYLSMTTAIPTALSSRVP
jgi:hypothetical protein